MRCIFCGCNESKVIDSRQSDDGDSIKRRRECVNCGRRFTTYEKIELTPVYVVKRNGNRQQFDSMKIKKGILLSCANRPIAMADIDKIVNNVEKQIYNTMKEEIGSAEIGELVMNELKKLDEIAYIRFASVYKQFKDSETFLEEMRKMLSERDIINGDDKDHNGNK